jgi:hypothetical protein
VALGNACGAACQTHVVVDVGCLGLLRQWGGYRQNAFKIHPADVERIKTPLIYSFAQIGFVLFNLISNRFYKSAHEVKPWQKRKYL